jgi:hypothetical protein
VSIERCQLHPPWFCKGELSDPWYFYGSPPWVFPFSLIPHAPSSLIPELLAFFLPPHWFFQWLADPWSRIPIPLLKMEAPTSWIGSESPVHDNSRVMTSLLCLPWYIYEIVRDTTTFWRVRGSLDASFAAEGHFGINKWCMTSITTTFWILHRHLMVQ